jgi:uncharacterized protein YfkK (UPF0435 family)
VTRGTPERLMRVMRAQSPRWPAGGRLLARSRLCYNGHIRPERSREDMDLSTPSEANISFMIDQIKNKLRMATGSVMQASTFSLERYEDLRDIYEMVMAKDRFSIRELEAIATELGRLRG